MAEDVHNKTEEPTPKRRDEARAQGNVPQSAEVTAAAVLFAGGRIMSHRGPTLVGALRDMMRRSLLAASASDFTPAVVGGVMRRLVSDTVRAAWPILAVTGSGGLGVTAAQVGVRFLPKRVIPDASKISPANGFQRIWSKRGGAELLKALIKIALVAWITWRLVIQATSAILI